MKKLISVVISLALVASAAGIVFAEGTSKQPTIKIQVPQEVKDKKAALKSLFDTARSTRESIKSTQGDVKEKLIDLKESFKDLSKEEKAAKKEEFKAIFDKIKGYRQDAKSTIEEMKAQRQSMDQYRVQLKEALKAKDFAKAETILDSMVNTKTAKNANLNELLEIRNEILAALQ